MEFSHFQLAVARLFSIQYTKIVNKLFTPSIAPLLITKHVPAITYRTIRIEM